MNNKYKVVYSGRLKPGTDVEKFVQAFMQVFKTPEAQARKLVGATQAVTLKSDLDQAAAEKYRQVMDTIGMEVQIEAIVPAKAELSLVPGEATPSPSVATSAAGPVAAPVAVAAEPAATTGPARCPKCGSDRVQGDDCLACGIIIPRYLEKQARLAAEAAAQETANPYAAPQSDVTPVHDVEEGGMTGPHGVPAGHGWQWIAGAWGYFKQSPLAWIGAVVVWIVLMMLTSLVPLLGPLALNLLTPVITAGFMLGAQEQRLGGSFEFRHLFAGFSANPGSLILVGLFYLVGIVAVMVVVGMMVGGAAFAMMARAQGGADPEMAAAMMQGPVLIALLVAMALMIPLIMAYWFAPALVALENVSPFAAMGMSFRACLKNILPFFVYSLIVMVLMIVAMIPLGLGMLVMAPVMLAAMYVSYRDIFYSAE